MRPIRIWAPYARTVAVVDADDPDAEPIALTTAPNDGWWTATPASSTPLRYYLRVDGVTIPDPRSVAQPEGLDGPSQTIAPFAWTDRDWIGREWGEAVVYELHVGTFTPEGTFDGVVGRLDHLVELGVDAIELMPVNTFPGERGWGYDGALIYAVHEPYGGPDGLRRLVDACHARGIAVVLDVVYNHFGPTGNHLASLGPYFTDAHRTPWGDAVNLDRDGSENVRRFFIDNALHWVLDFHVDGLRLDAVHAFHDESDRPFLRQLADDIHALGHELGRFVWVIGESDLNDPRLVDRDDPEAPAHFDAVWSDDFHHALHVALTGETDGYYEDFADGWRHVALALENVYVYDGIHSRHRGREHGHRVERRGRRRFLAYTQNHDQVGNRAAGERLGHLADRRAVEAAAALVILSPFTPLLFMGEEWMASTPFQYFTDHRDPDVAAAVTKGRRAEFARFAAFSGDAAPDPQDEATFGRSRLEWSETDQPEHRAVLDWYRSLIDLRRTHPALRTDGADDTKAQHDPAADTFVMVRAGRLAVVVNTGEQPVDLDAAFAGRVLMRNDGRRDHLLEAGATAVVERHDR